MDSRLGSQRSWMLFLVLAALGWVWSPSTTTASAASFGYDAPTIARGDVHHLPGPDAVEPHPIAAKEASATPSVKAQGTSTTHLALVVATNTVRPGTDLVKYEAYPPAATSPRSFVGGPVRDTLQPGTAISRYGGEGGTFASPAGTPFSARGLPPGHEALGESRYVFAQPLEVDAGIAAYWQGGGGGIQYDLPRSISDLVNDGILKRLP